MMNIVNFKEKTIIIGSLILLLVIGFAAVTTTLLINGNARIGENSDDFKIYFSRVVDSNGGEDGLITNEERTRINFDVRLVNVGETYRLLYEITNSSRNYDGNFELVYRGDKSEYYTIKNEIDNSIPLKAQEKRMGMITIELVKGYVGEEDLDLDISYELVFSPIERDHLAVVVEPIKIATGHCSNKDCEEDDYRQKSVWGKWNYKLSLDLVEKIVIKDTNDVPSDVIDSWDASASGNGSIMGYALDEDNSGLVELYLRQNGGVVANENSSWLFGGFKELTTIEGLENLDTSNVVDMSNMFCDCSNLTSLDLSNFDTSNVTDMSFMFRDCRNLISLDLSSFDTSNVTDMSGMFRSLSDSAKILVKDEKTQQWILALDSNNRPSAWTTENVIVAT